MIDDASTYMCLNVHPLGSNLSENRLTRDTVTEDDIASVVARSTGIPVNRLMQGEMTKLLHLQQDLDARVVGQQQATKVVAEAVQIPVSQLPLSLSWVPQVWARLRCGEGSFGSLQYPSATAG